MGFTRLLATVVVITAIASSTAAQIVPIGPFSGDLSEGFESAVPMQASACVQPNVFGGAGSLCDPFAFGAYVTNARTWTCTVLAHSGMLFTYSSGAGYACTFNQDVTDFGGYFAIGNGHPDVLFNFFDASGLLIGSSTVQVPSDCQWHWQGWQSTGSPIRQVQIIGLDSGSGGDVPMDDLEIKLRGCNPNITTYCTSKLSSSGCTPNILAAGVSSLSNPSAFQVSTFLMELQKSAITFFGTTGPNGQPFQGGYLCVKVPHYRLAIKSTGSGASCGGFVSYTLQDMVNHPTGGALVVAGATINCQTWFRDPASQSTTGLSGGVEFSVCQ